MSNYELPHHIAEGKSFEPYELNGGNVVAIAGNDYAIIGSDTRLCVKFSLITRNQKKLFQMSEHSVLGVTGCWGDALAVSRIVKARIQMYKNENGKSMSTPALAQMLSTILYYKRFFPYYVLTVVAGLDQEGKGCIFSYDPIGHYERSMFRASGTAGAIIQPLLDNQIGLSNMPYAVEEDVTLAKATSTLKDAFIAADERDIYTGDNIQILTITNNGISEEYFNLRKD